MMGSVRLSLLVLYMLPQLLAFICAAVLLCVEDTVSLLLPTTSAFYNLPASPPLKIPHSLEEGDAIQITMTQLGLSTHQSRILYI